MHLRSMDNFNHFSSQYYHSHQPHVLALLVSHPPSVVSPKFVLYTLCSLAHAVFVTLQSSFTFLRTVLDSLVLMFLGTLSLRTFRPYFLIQIMDL